MSVSLEKIDMLMERANISYKEAKEALERHDGDMVEALIELEASNKTGKPKLQSKSVKVHVQSRKGNPHKSDTDFFEDVKKFFEKMHKTSFVIGKKGHRVLDIPLTIAGLIVLFTMPVSLFLLILPYLFGYKILILDPDGKKMKVEDAFDFGNAPKEEKKEEEDRMK
ncbi:MAG: DUF4342 domain-containing protein [Clostridiales bacterium]|jgi:hypothetical protein|nr:DUF4342 domain-containing protein [Clostridiales bacterium]